MKGHGDHSMRADGALRGFLAGIAVFSIATLGACVSPAPGPKTLTAGEIRETLTGEAISRCGNALLGTWRYTAWHRRDGTMEAVALAGERREDATGTWRVTGSNPSGADLYCRTWNNGWADGLEGCFRVTRTGDALTFDHVSGAAGEATTYSYSLGEACG